MIFGKDTFYIQAIALRPSGLQLCSDTLSNFKLLIISAVGCFYACFSMFRLVYETRDSVDEFSETAAPAVQCFIGMWKGSILWRNRKNIATSITELREFIERATEEEKKILLLENRNDKYLSGFFCIMAFLAGSASLFAPVFVAIGKFLIGGEITLFLPYKGNYMLDPEKVPTYWAIFFICTLSTYFVVNMCLILDSIFSWFSHNIVAQFRILTIKLEQANIKYENDMLELENSITNCIRDHQKIILIAERMSKSFESIVFVQYSLCAVQLCLIAYQFIRGIVMNQVPFMVTFIVAVCMQMILYSYNGDRLKNESEDFALGVYNTMRWQQANIRPRKMLMLVMLRAQKPVILSGIFFDVNWNLFVEVMKTTASYVTLMKSLK